MRNIKKSIDFLFKMCYYRFKAINQRYCTLTTEYENMDPNRARTV